MFIKTFYLSVLLKKRQELLESKLKVGRRRGVIKRRKDMKKISMSKKGSPWTVEEEVDLLEGLRKGLTFENLARAHERTVKAMAWRWGMHCKKKMEQGKTPEQLIAEFHVSPDFFFKTIDELASSKQQQPNGGGGSNPVKQDCCCKQRLEELSDKIDRLSRLIKKLLLQQPSSSKKNKKP